MYKVNVTLRNGTKIEIIARKFNFEWSSSSGKFVGYSFSGITSHDSFGLNLDEIVAYEAWEMTTDQVTSAKEDEGERVG
ncbi:hypothetical protein ACYCSE_17450 [Paenibacillus sp. SEL1]